MSLTPEEREVVIETAVQILKHRKRERLAAILAQRIENGDYPCDEERQLDQIALAIARAVEEELNKISLISGHGLWRSVFVVAVWI